MLLLDLGKHREWSVGSPRAPVSLPEWSRKDLKQIFVWCPFPLKSADCLFRVCLSVLTVGVASGAIFLKKASGGCVYARYPRAGVATLPCFGCRHAALLRVLGGRRASGGGRAAAAGGGGGVSLVEYAKGSVQ